MCTRSTLSLPVGTERRSSPPSSSRIAVVVLTDSPFAISAIIPDWRKLAVELTHLKTSIFFI